MRRPSIILVLVISLFSLLVVGCGEDPVTVAKEVAEDWTNTSVAEVSEDIGEFVTLNIPVVKNIATSIIEGAIRDNITWDYAEPLKISENKYLVVVTANANIDIIIASYVVSLDYSLEIDTKNKKVLYAPFDISSLTISER